ncbi:MAG: hypothetical protein IJ301_00510 [Clostridia bacterium]|nr:hypothetical protein [Clostridia bacterium]
MNNDIKNMVISPEVEKIALLELTPRHVRLVLAWYVPNTSFEIFDEFFEPVKIYEDIDRDGFIKPTQIAEVVKTVKMYRKLCDSLKVSKATAYATPAFREAKNHYGFLEELEIASGFKIRLMQEQDEIVSVYNGVINTLDAPKGVVVYIEDDYAQIIHYSRKSILNSVSIQFGSESLATLFMDSAGNPEKQMEEMTAFFKERVEQDAPWLSEIDKEEFKFVGVGDIFLSIGKISRRGRKYPLDMPHSYTLSDADFYNVYNAIKVLDLDKRSRLRGISEKSANNIASGLAMVRAIIDGYGVDKFTIAATDSATGVLFNQCVPVTMEKPIVDVVMFSLMCNMHFYPVSVENSTNVYYLATVLFRQLRVMHKLGRQYIRALKVASFMYDCGSRMRFHPSRKDALEVILHTRIYGVSHRDLILAAFIASSQNSEEFSLSDWVRFKDIVTEDDLAAVKKLAVILKIAVALDRTQQGLITDLVCDVLGDSVIMKTVSNNQDISFELKCAKEASADFKKVFGKNLELL